MASLCFPVNSRLGPRPHHSRLGCQRSTTTLHVGENPVSNSLESHQEELSESARLSIWSVSLHALSDLDIRLCFEIPPWLWSSLDFGGKQSSRPRTTPFRDHYS